MDSQCDMNIRNDLLVVGRSSSHDLEVVLGAIRNLNESHCEIFAIVNLAPPVKVVALNLYMQVSWFI